MLSPQSTKNTYMTTYVLLNLALRSRFIKTEIDLKVQHWPERFWNDIELSTPTRVSSLLRHPSGMTINYSYRLGIYFNLLPLDLKVNKLSAPTPNLFLWRVFTAGKSLNYAHRLGLPFCTPLDLKVVKLYAPIRDSTFCTTTQTRRCWPSRCDPALNWPTHDMKVVRIYDPTRDLPRYICHIREDYNISTPIRDCNQ